MQGPVSYDDLLELYFIDEIIYTRQTTTDRKLQIYIVRHPSFY